jgi:glucose/arabinose dehydrogenase
VNQHYSRLETAVAPAASVRFPRKSLSFLIVAIVIALALVSTSQSLWAQLRPAETGHNNEANPAAAAVSFQKSKLQNVAITNPTSLDFGPDGRLYVAQQNGVIYAYTVARLAANSYTATVTETITLIQAIPNHNDDGSLAPNINTRQVTGILAAGTASNPVLYVSSSDPRTFVQIAPAAQSIDTNSGMVSRLTWNGASWDKVDLVRGLPRSKENHSVNGMTLDANTNTLYLTVGGNTNMGAPSTSFAKLPEYALSAALLSIDLDAIGDNTYDLPTLDDEDRAGANDLNDPFGGNGGKNQAIIDPTGPVQVYSPGYRNAYGVLHHSNGELYIVENGANEGWGNIPVGCTNALQDNGATEDDVLLHITGPGFYGGHPNPTRGSLSNTFNSTNPQSPAPSANAVECTHIDSGSENGFLGIFNSSTNGIVEYTASNFSGAMKGNVLTSSYNGAITRFQLDAAGSGLAKPAEVILAGYDNFTLDLAVQDDNGAFPGTIWAITYYGGPVWVFEPSDTNIACTGADNTALDEDGDGFTNADELDNNTDPCSGGSLPFDSDNDNLSDLNDPDDDNDGVNDTTDRFALDADNGQSTTLPVLLSWDNGDPDPGGILSLGFTGLMNNGANYRGLYDSDKIISGGAAGIVTLTGVPAGDAYAAQNDQLFGFQFGVKVVDEGAPFTIHTLLKTPFKGKSVQDTTSVGIYFGTGDQDNYLKLVADANGGQGGIRVVREVNGNVTLDQIYGPEAGVNLLGADDVDLMLHINAVGQLATIAYAADGGAETALGDLITLPAAWFSHSQAAAIGIISTATTANSFAASWDFLNVTSTPAAGPATIFLPLIKEAAATQTTAVTAARTNQPTAVNAAPFANAGSNWVLVDADNDGKQLVKLSGIGSYDPDNDIASYEWSSDTALTIADGVTTTVELPVGVHNVTLTVTDSENQSNTDDVIISVLASADTPILYRVNAGGDYVTPANGSLVSWSADSYHSPSIYLEPTSLIRAFLTTATIDMSDPTIAGTAVTPYVMQIERYAQTTEPGQQMSWNFPLSETASVDVRIYLAEIWFDEPELRTFDIAIEGVIPEKFNDIKMFETVGVNKAYMITDTVTVTDGNLDLDFISVLENPAVKAIEIVKAGSDEIDFRPKHRILLPVVKR